LEDGGVMFEGQLYRQFNPQDPVAVATAIVY
jgi:hypothetical protein